MWALLKAEGAMTFLAICLLFYFAPALVAHSRRHSAATGLFVTNLLLGWTVIGWVVCLIWALSGPREVVFFAPSLFAGYGPGVAPGWGLRRLADERCCGVCQRPVCANARYCSMCGATAGMRS